MRYTITFFEDDYKLLTDHLFSKGEVEQAAYLRCRLSVTDSEVRLLIRQVVTVTSEDIEVQTDSHMKIKASSFLRVMKQADQKKENFVFVHSHPNGLREHSKQDDIEEAMLFKTAYIRIRTGGVHASIVFSNPNSPAGRVWLEDGTTSPVDLIRVIGKTIKYYFRNSSEDLTDLLFFDRQTRAFGHEIQPLLKSLSIGVVGVGGTGSAVVEQLIRLGVGRLLLCDDDLFDSSNINRVYGSRVSDKSILKVKLLERLAKDIGLGTVVEVLPKRISFASSVKKLINCDMIFGCTDDEWGRSILTRLAIYYFIPVFDVGVRIDSTDGVIKSIQGRVTTLIPSSACLFCRGRITADGIRAESLHLLNPEEAEKLRKEGYIRGLEETAPAVIPFTTAVASSAISEFLHRITGCLGGDRETSEVLHLFDLSRIGTNSRKPESDCFCGDRYYWGRGDATPLLDTTWPQE